jgi:hypothetical protein
MLPARGLVQHSSVQLGPFCSLQHPLSQPGIAAIGADPAAVASNAIPTNIVRRIVALPFVAKPSLARQRLG